MKVDGNPNRFLQPFGERIGLERRQESGHVLDADAVRAQVFQSFGLFHKVVQAVHRADRIANRGFHVFVALPDHSDGGLKIANVVQGVENAKDVNAVFRGLDDESFQDVVGIMSIPDQVLPAQQHLQLGVGRCLAEGAQPFPRIFFQKSQAGVERGASPDFQ